MGKSELELIGYKLLVKNHPAFVSQMNSANKAAEKFLDTAARGTKKPLELVSGDMLKRIDVLRERMIGVTQKALAYRGGIVGAAAQTDAFKNILASLNPTAALVAGGLAVLTVGAIKFGQSLMKLGARGATVDGVVFAFSRIAAVAGTTSDTLLGEMRRAAAGTVADLDLMKRANLALAGAQGETAKQIAQSLPKLLEIARAQARATGQDVNYLFESLVTGVKRSAPLLIDNTGIVLKVGSANEKMAASLGKTVDELTDQERQLAVLNATLEAGQIAIDLYGAKQRGASAILAGMSVRIQNMMDRLAVSIQPAYTLILEIGDALLASIVTPIQDYVIPIIYELTKAIFGPLLDGWRSIKEGVQNAAAPAFNFLKKAMIPVVATIRLIGMAWRWLLETTGKVLKPMLDLVKAFVERTFSTHLNPQKFFEGGANSMGALAAGMLRAANEYIFPAILFITKVVADFLIGMSPPPKGPLSAIDQGGANTMLAWLAGFTGVSLDPVEQVADQVNRTLGSIAGQGLEQVEARIAVLDAAIQPFDERLKLIESHMNAILNPLKQIEGVLDRRLDSALGDFFGGKADAESVRALDRQKESLQARVDGVQSISDEAAYQLSLKQLEQVGERNLLQIQLARLKALDQEKTLVDKVNEEAYKAGKEPFIKEDKLTGGAGSLAEEIAAAVGGGLDALSLPDDPVGAFLGLDEEAIKQSMAGISGAFKAGYVGAGGMDALADAESYAAQIQKKLKEADDANVGTKLQEKFKGIFGLGPDGLIADVVKWGAGIAVEITKIDATIGDIPILGGFVERFKNNFATTGPLGVGLSVFRNLLSGHFSPGGEIGKILDGFNLLSFINKWEEGFDLPGFGIRQHLDNFLTNLTQFAAPDTGDIMTRLTRLSLDPFGLKWTDMLDTPGLGIRQTIDNFLTKLTLFASPEDGDIMSRLNPLNLDPFGLKWTDMFDNPALGIVRALSKFMDLLTGIFGEKGFIVGLFSGIGDLLDRFMLKPIRGALNGMIGAFEGALNGIVDTVNNFTQSGAMGFFTSLTGQAGLGDLKLDRVNIPRLRSGALAAQGMMQLHRDELVMARKPVTVFPQALSRQIMSALSGPRAESRTVMGPQAVDNSRSSVNHSNVTNHNTFYSEQGYRLALAKARAYG